jgi:hypothetical protein
MVTMMLLAAAFRPLRTKSLIDAQMMDSDDAGTGIITNSAKIADSIEARSA